MSIGCIKNTNDLQNKKQEFAEYLQLMIDNESIKEKRIKDYKNPNKPPPVPPQYKTASEQAQDLMTQEKLAFDNMKELGIDISEIRSFVMQLEQKQDGIDNLVKLNRNFPAFKKIISEKYLAKTLTAPLLLNAWEGFSANINAITGLKSVSSSATNIYTDATNNYTKIPSDNDLAKIKSNLDIVNSNTLLVFPNNFILNTINNILEASKFLLTDTTIGKIDDLTPIEKSKISKIVEDLITIYKIPTKDEFTKIGAEIATLASAPITDSTSVQINDELTSKINFLNRLLGQLINPINVKKLNEYNNYTNNILSSLYTPNLGFTTSETKISENVSGITTTSFPNLENKVEMINYIIQQKLYLFTALKINSKNINKLEEQSIKLRKEGETNEAIKIDEKIEVIKQKIKSDLNLIPTSKLKSFLKSYKKRLQDEEFGNRGSISKDLDNQELYKEGVEEPLGVVLKNNKDAFDSLGLELEDYKMIFNEILQLPYVQNLDAVDRKVLTNQVSLNWNNKDNLQEFIISLGEDETDLGEQVKDLLMKIYDEVGKEKDEQIKNDKRTLILHDLLKKQNYTEDEVSIIIQNIVDYLTSTPNSESKVDALSAITAVVNSYVAGSSELDDVLFLIASLHTYNKNLNDIIRGFLSGGKPAPAPAKATREDRAKELSNITSKPTLQAIYKNIIGRDPAKSKSMPVLRREILDKEFPIFGSGMSRPQARRITEAVNTPDFDPHFEDSYSSEEETNMLGFGVRKKKKKGGDLIHIDIGSHIGKNYKEAGGKGFTSKNWVGKAKKDYQSGGDQPYIKSRIKIGSGISKTESPTYQEFGKFIIHTPQLEKNILNFKYPSLGRVPSLPRMNIDDDTKDLIFNILETGKMSENQFNKIPQSQQDYLIKAIKGAGLESILFKGKCKVYPKDEKEDRDRFNILKGEFDAGNDNPALIKELRALVIKFSNCGIIPKKQGLEFLTILNDI